MFRIIDGVDISCPRDRAAVFQEPSSDIVGGEAYWQGPQNWKPKGISPTGSYCP